MVQMNRRLRGEYGDLCVTMRLGSAFDRKFGTRDRTFEASARLTQGCVKMDQSLRPTGTDCAERCPTGNLIGSAPCHTVCGWSRKLLPMGGGRVSKGNVPGLGCQGKR